MQTEVFIIQTAGESDEKESTWCRFSWCRGIDEPRWEEFSHRFEWQVKARETDRVWEIFTLEPVGEQERKCTECFFFLFFSHLRILSSPGALRSAEHPRSPPLTCPALPSLVCENKNSLRSLSFLPSFSFFHTRAKTTWGALLYKTLSEMNLLPGLPPTCFWDHY